MTQKYINMKKHVSDYELTNQNIYIIHQSFKWENKSTSWLKKIEKKRRKKEKKRKIDIKQENNIKHKHKTKPNT